MLQYIYFVSTRLANANKHVSTSIVQYAIDGARLTICRRVIADDLAMLLVGCFGAFLLFFF